MSYWLALAPWLNVLGLLLDLIGVVLISREWVLAFDHDAREAQLAARQELVRPRPGVPQPQFPGREIHEDMRRRHDFQSRQQRARETWAARRSWFMAAFVVIALGYVLQLIASVPVAPFVR